jgi:hypothetical protein
MRRSPLRPALVLSLFAAAGALAQPSRATAGGFHHHKQPHYVAVPAGTLSVQPAAAVPTQMAVPVQMAVPQFQLAVPQLQTVQMAIPQQVQTVQFSVPQVQTVQMSIPQPQPQQSIPQFEVRIVEAPRPAAAPPQQAVPPPAAPPKQEFQQASPQSPSPAPQQAAPQPQQAAPQPQQGAPAPSNDGTSLAPGQTYQLYKIVEHRCHLFCKH